MVDLPTPEEPTRAMVSPTPHCATSSPRPLEFRALTMSTVTPAAATSSSRHRAAGSCSRSVLLSTMMGSAPLSQTVAR